MVERIAPAIVFGGDINGLGIVRNLGREGIPVHCVLESADPAIYSKYCSGYYVLPDFSHRPDSVRSFLSRLSRRATNRPVVFSTDDRTTLILSSLKDEMENEYAFMVPDKQVAETLVIKNRFYQSLDEKGIDHPKVIQGSADSDIRSIGKELGYQVFVRPSVTQDFSEVFEGRKGFVADSEAELLNQFARVRARNIKVLFQEVIPGPAANIYGIAGCFGHDSQPLALFGYHRMRGWPPLIGLNTLIESLPLSELRPQANLVAGYLRSIGYYGVMEAEFKLDPRDGRYRLLEINARSWFQNSFPTRCGLNIILKAYLDAVGTTTPYSEDYRAGVKWVNLLQDIAASVTEGEMMRSSWIRSLIGVEDNAFFDLSDLAPVFMSTLYEIGILGNRQGRLRPQRIRKLVQRDEHD
jgi:predicted ATP-grasp superfamily ATP-dependent carboligase